MDLLASLRSRARAGLESAVWRVGVVAAVVHVLVAWRVLGLADPPPLRDSIIFEYYGWYLTEGATLYVDAWEFKPPLTFELAAVLAALAGPNVALYHTLAVAVTVAAAVACAVLVAATVREFVGDDQAAAVAGLAVLAFPEFVLRAGYGLKPKYFVLAATLGAVLAARRDRPALAGVAAAVAVGTWQLGAVAPVLAALAFPRNDDESVVDAWTARPRFGRFALAGVATSLAILAPVLLAGPDAVRAMVAQTIVAPVVLGESGTVADRFVRLLFTADLAAPVFLVGVAGVARAARRDLRRYAPLTVGTAWFALSVLVFDFDAAPDLFVLFGFAAVGVGLWVTDCSPRRRRQFVAVAALLCAASAAAALGVPGLAIDAPTGGPVADADSVTAPYNTNAERRALYWHRLRPETCHVFPNRKQWAWIEMTDGDLVAETCGRFPKGW